MATTNFGSLVTHWELVNDFECSVVFAVKFLMLIHRAKTTGIYVTFGPAIYFQDADVI